jgi:hypothetical protein
MSAFDKEEMRKLRIGKEMGDAIVAAARHQAIPPPQVEVDPHPDFYTGALQLKDAQRVRYPRKGL